MSTPSIGPAMFTPLVGEAFSVALAEGAVVDLRLTMVTPAHSASGAASGGPPGRDGFSLLFSGPATAPLPQGTYVFSHPAFEALAIFIVPVGRDGPGLVYEAVFG